MINGLMSFKKEINIVSRKTSMYEDGIYIYVYV